jgi:GNAT superfamily N-acetyltransferase
VSAVTIRKLTAAEADAQQSELADVLVDAVAHGASVNFMTGFMHDEALAFWRGQIDGVASGDRSLLVASDGRSIVGTVIVYFMQQPNQPHRAEIGKMLVHSSLRRQGLGRRLLEAAEAEALAAGRTLLMLDTETGSAGDKLYRACGWIEFGKVPGHAYRPGGELATTTFFYKNLSVTHRAPPARG